MHICYDDTLFSITFEPLVRFGCFNLGFEALDVYFSMKPLFYYLIGPLSLESAGKRTELSKKCGLISAVGLKDADLATAKVLKGTCTDICPRDIYLRLSEGGVRILLNLYDLSTPVLIFCIVM